MGSDVGRCRKCSDSGRRTTSLLEAVEHVDKEVVHHIQDLIVVLVDGHLKVQPCELAQMPVREGLLCPAQCKLPLSSTGYTYLQLWSFLHVVLSSSKT